MSEQEISLSYVDEKDNEKLVQLEEVNEFESNNPFTINESFTSNDNLFTSDKKAKSRLIELEEISGMNYTYFLFHNSVHFLKIIIHYLKL